MLDPFAPCGFPLPFCAGRATVGPAAAGAFHLVSISQRPKQAAASAKLQASGTLRAILPSTEARHPGSPRRGLASLFSASPIKSGHHASKGALVTPLTAGQPPSRSWPPSFLPIKVL